MALQLGVSRIPVMRACQRLVSEGFLELNSRRTMVVIPHSEERVSEEFSLLSDLECMAVRVPVSSYPCSLVSPERGAGQDHWAAAGPQPPLVGLEGDGLVIAISLG